MSKALRSVLLFLAANVVFSCVIYLLIDGTGILPRLPAGLYAFALEHPNWWCVFVWLTVNALGFVVCLRRAIIGVIRLYQRYADEDVRRRCIFMPTCSEYAVLALEKHCLVIGLLRAFDRVYYRCRGNIYRIDYP